MILMMTRSILNSRTPSGSNSVVQQIVTTCHGNGNAVAHIRSSWWIVARAARKESSLSVRSPSSVCVCDGKRGDVVNEVSVCVAASNSQGGGVGGRGGGEQMHVCVYIYIHIYIFTYMYIWLKRMRSLRVAACPLARPPAKLAASLSGRG